jgi:hypothetical protein
VIRNVEAAIAPARHVGHDARSPLQATAIHPKMIGVNGFDGAREVRSALADRRSRQEVATGRSRHGKHQSGLPFASAGTAQAAAPASLK